LISSKLRANLVVPFAQAQFKLTRQFFQLSIRILLQPAYTVRKSDLASQQLAAAQLQVRVGLQQSDFIIAGKLKKTSIP